jgi:hypothetical protein
MSLNVKSLAAGASKVFPVQLMGTKTIKASRVIGANIFTLHMKMPIRINKITKHFKSKIRSK